MPSNVSDNIADRFELGSPDIPNIQHAFELIARSYRLHPDPQSFNIDAQQIIDWVQSNLNDEERASLKQQLGKITGNTKEAISDRVLEALDYLHTKLLTQDKKVNLATVQELVQQWEEAEAQLQKQGDPADKLVAKYHKRRAVHVVSLSVASKAEREISSTPPQVDPRMKEVIAEAFKDIPKADQVAFHKKVADLTQLASTATPDEYHRYTQELVDQVEKATGQPLSPSLKKEVMSYFPPLAPLTNKTIVQELENKGNVQEVAEYIQKNTASHLTQKELEEVSQQYLEHSSTNPAPLVLHQIDLIRQFSHNEELTPEQTARLVHEVTPLVVREQAQTVSQDLKSRVNSIDSSTHPEALQALQDELILSKEMASVVTTRISSKGPSQRFLLDFFDDSSTEAGSLALRTGVSQEQASQILALARGNVLAQNPTSQNAQKYLTGLGFDAYTAKDFTTNLLTLFSLDSPADLVATRPLVIDFLATVPKSFSKDLSAAELSKFEDQIHAQVSQLFPQNSPEQRSFDLLSPLLAKGFSSSPDTIQATLASTVRLYTFSGAGNTSSAAISRLSPLIETIRLANPHVNQLVSATSTILESYSGLTPQQLSALSNQLVLFHLSNPLATKDKFSEYFGSQVLHKLDGLGFRDNEKVKNLFQDLDAHFRVNPLKLSGDQQLISSISTRFIKAGLTPEQAKVLAPHAYEAAKFGFFLAGFTPNGRDLNETKAYQAAAFAESFKVGLASLAEKHPFLAQLQNAGNFKRLGTAQIFNDLHAVLGDPKALTPDFLVKIQSPFLYGFTQGISTFVPEPLKPLLTNFAQKLLETNFLQSDYGKSTNLSQILKVLAAGPTKFQPLILRSAINFRDPIRTLKVLNKLTGIRILNQIALADTAFKFSPTWLSANAIKIVHNFGLQVKAVGNIVTKPLANVMAKLAATKAGQALAKTGVATFIKGVSQAIGTALPLIGNLIALAAGWVAGEIIGKILVLAGGFFRWLKNEGVPALAAFVAGIGIFSGGGGVAASLLGAAATGLSTSAIQGMLTGKTFGTSANAVQAAASKFNYVATTLATSSIASSFSAAVAAVIATPVVIAFFLFIINSGAFVVPPTIYNSGSGVGFQNNSSCPLASGQITTFSYDNARQESQGSGNRYHGTNGYWRDVMGSDTREYCTFHLPGDGVTCAPVTGDTNYCFIQPNCTQGNQRNPFYGYAIDIVSGDRNVYLPQINGQSATWRYNGNPFCNDAGCAHSYTTDAPDGNTYDLLFIHMGPSVDPSKTLSGQPFGTLFDQGSNTHLHLEAQINHVYVKPEQYFCGTSVAPTSGVVPPLDSDCSPEARGNEITFGSVQTLPSSSRTGYCIVPRYIVMHWSGAWNGVQGTYNTFLGNQSSCQFGTDEAVSLQMLQTWDNRVEMAKNCANEHNTDSINIEMSGTCFSLMRGFTTCDEPSEVQLPPESEIQRTVDLVCRLKDQYNISMNNIIGHYEYNSGKADPGRQFLQDNFLPRVEAACP